MKKLKLLGEPYKIMKNTAFIKTSNSDILEGSLWLVHADKANNIKLTIENEVDSFCNNKRFPIYFLFKMGYKQFILLFMNFNKLIISYIRKFV
jgi:hypothetical protein